MSSDDLQPWEAELIAGMEVRDGKLTSDERSRSACAFGPNESSLHVRNMYRRYP